MKKVTYQLALADIRSDIKMLYGKMDWYPVDKKEMKDWLRKMEGKLTRMINNAGKK